MRQRELDYGRFLNRLCDVPDQAWTHVQDDTLICRCEEITMGEIRKAVKDGFHTSVILKKATRCGMGHCQGRTCSPMILDILAALTGKSPKQIGMPSARTPVKTAPISAFTKEA